MATISHLSDVLTEINPLIIETMNYELLLRGIRPAQAPTTKKVQLARELVKEQQGNGCTQWPFMTLQDDLRACASLFAQFDAMLNSATRTTLSIESALINLAFLKIRVERLNSSSHLDLININMMNTNIDNAIQKGKQILQASQNSMTPREEIIDLIGDIESVHNTTEHVDIQPLFASMNLNPTIEPRVTNPSANTFHAHTNNNRHTNQFRFNQNVPLSSTNANQTKFNANSFPNQNFNGDSNQNQHYEQFRRPNMNFNENLPNFQNENFSQRNPNSAQSMQPQNFRNPDTNQNFPMHTQSRRDHKMYKWNVKFTGENSKYDAIDFIQKVNAIAQSRGVTDRELFDSAIEFFSGQALKWYYAQRNQINSWPELSEKLISDFIEVNYYDNLLDTIRQRRQTQNDSIVNFFTIFEDDCSRLQTLLSPREQIHIVKKNVLQKYRPHISLKNYNSLNELKQDLKLLEASMLASNDRNVSFTVTPSAHTSRYDSYRGNRSFSRSPSNSSNANRTNQQSPSRFSANRPSTPIPSEHKRNTSFDRSDKRSQSPYDKRRNESHDLNKNSTRSTSRDSNSSQQFKSPNHLNR